MVDHELGGEQRIDALRISAESFHGLAHGGKVDDGGNTSEILQQNARGHERGFSLLPVGSPSDEGANVFGVHKAAVFKSQKVLEENAQGERKMGERAKALFF